MLFPKHIALFDTEFSLDDTSVITDGDSTTVGTNNLNLSFLDAETSLSSIDSSFTIVTLATPYPSIENFGHNEMILQLVNDIRQIKAPYIQISFDLQSPDDLYLLSILEIDQNDHFVKVTADEDSHFFELFLKELDQYPNLNSVIKRIKKCEKKIHTMQLTDYTHSSEIFGPKSPVRSRKMACTVLLDLFFLLDDLHEQIVHKTPMEFDKYMVQAKTILTSIEKGSNIDRFTTIEPLPHFDQNYCQSILLLKDLLLMLADRGIKEHRDLFHKSSFTRNDFYDYMSSEFLIQFKKVKETHQVMSRKDAHTLFTFLEARAHDIGVIPEMRKSDTHMGLPIDNMQFETSKSSVLEDEINDLIQRHQNISVLLTLLLNDIQSFPKELASVMNCYDKPVGEVFQKFLNKSFKIDDFDKVALPANAISYILLDRVQLSCTGATLHTAHCIAKEMIEKYATELSEVHAKILDLLESESSQITVSIHNQELKIKDYQRFKYALIEVLTARKYWPSATAHFKGARYNMKLNLET